MLINERGQFVAQVCHIESAEPGGQRFNPKQSDDDRRSESNLMLMCYRHHVETNDVDLYPVSELQRIIAAHQRKYQENQFSIGEKTLGVLVAEFDSYWRKIEILNGQHNHDALVVKVDKTLSLVEIVQALDEDIRAYDNFRNALSESDSKLLNEIRSFMEACGYALDKLEERIKETDDRFAIRNWEWHVLAGNNIGISLRKNIAHLGILALQQHLLKNPEDQEAKTSLRELERRLEELASGIYWFD